MFNGVFESSEFEFDNKFFRSSVRFRPWRTSRARWMSVGVVRLITPRVRWRLPSGRIAFGGMSVDSGLVLFMQLRACIKCTGDNHERSSDQILYNEYGKV